ncbi:MAG: sigma-70 family RNA polymerase sigma factor [Clostridium sp.]|nr:sigma-70 family RNA polymerase sigma factor [Clostridium sp.]MCM1171631.1 sigma-70 family RNA polymerase sigma factor [Clostridium sp.]MCM1207890.1 sigma-70 family RNA polymerase sigma factor [Ruminococcus sp.]
MNEARYVSVVKQYSDTVYRVALSYTKKEADAEDVVQSVFMKLFVTDTVFADEDHVRKWLIRVTVNECKNFWKSFWQQRVDSMEALDGEVSFSSEEKSELYYAVMDLPKKYRVVVHLFYYEGYSTQEIAALLHIRDSAVRNQLVRARKRLKQQLREAWKDE